RVVRRRRVRARDLEAKLLPPCERQGCYEVEVELTEILERFDEECDHGAVGSDTLDREQAGVSCRVLQHEVSGGERLLGVGRLWERCRRRGLRLWQIDRIRHREPGRYRRAEGLRRRRRVRVLELRDSLVEAVQLLLNALEGAVVLVPLDDDLIGEVV